MPKVKLIVPEGREETVRKLGEWFRQKETKTATEELAKLSVLKDVLGELGCTYEVIEEQHKEGITCRKKS